MRIGCRCRRPVLCYTDNPGIRWRKRLCGRPRCGGVTGCRAWTQRAVPFSTASTTRKHRLKSPLTPSLSFDVKIAIGLPLTSTYFPPIYMSCLCEHMTPQLAHWVQVPAPCPLLHRQPREAALRAPAVLNYPLETPDAAVTPAPRPTPSTYLPRTPPPFGPFPAFRVARHAWQVAWTGASWGGGEGARAPPAECPPRTGDIMDWTSLTVCCARARHPPPACSRSDWFIGPEPCRP